VVEGKFDERLDAIKQFLEEMDASFFNFILLNHWKDRYMPDYQLLKEKGLIRKGSGIFADNMGFFATPAEFKPPFLCPIIRISAQMGAKGPPLTSGAILRIVPLVRGGPLAPIRAELNPNTPSFLKVTLGIYIYIYI